MSEQFDELKQKKLFILDMDGTFYLGNKLIPGSLEFLEKLRQKGIDFIFFTNNSSRTRQFYKQKLAAMGCFVDEYSIVTSGDVTIRFLRENYSDASVYLVGTDLLEQSFIDGGIKLTQNDPDFVVLGFDTTLTYEKIERACTFIRNGAVFIATHLDLNCPTEDGFIPDCGAMCAMIEASTGVKPRYLGKPFKDTVDMIKLLTGRNSNEMAFVGDRLYTDVAVCVNNGITGILVLSGETVPGDIEKSSVKPDYIFESLYELGKVL